MKLRDRGAAVQKEWDDIQGFGCRNKLQPAVAFCSRTTSGLTAGWPGTRELYIILWSTAAVHHHPIIKIFFAFLIEI